MKILVCMKQVPAGTKVDIDPETGAMKRLSGETRTNPYDLFALEAALQLREKVGGSVTVLTMGPPQAEEMMRDAYTMGADDAVILSDRKFAGADVLATSYALSQGITAIGDIDLIICGKQTTDGDTAQVGPAIAEHLGIPHAAWVSEIVDADMTFEDMADQNLSKYGLVGSPTAVEKMFAPPEVEKQVYFDGDAKEKTKQLFDVLVNKKVI